MGVFLSSCADVVPVDEIAEQQKLMLHCEAPIGGEITATLQRTIPINGSVAGGIEKNARISIIYNDGIDEQITLVWQEDRNLYSGGLARIRPNERTTIRVEIAGEDQLNVTSTMLHAQPRAIDSIKLASALSVMGGQHTVSIALQIPPVKSALGEYYHIIPRRRQAFVDSLGVVYGTLQPMAVREVWNDNMIVQPLGGGNGILVDGERLDGELIELDLASMGVAGNEITTAVHFEVRSVTKDYYYFHSSRSRVLANFDDPNQTPVIIGGNVKNGYGLYASYISRRDSIAL